MKSLKKALKKLFFVEQNRAVIYLLTLPNPRHLRPNLWQLTHLPPVPVDTNLPKLRFQIKPNAVARRGARRVKRRGTFKIKRAYSVFYLISYLLTRRRGADTSSRISSVCPRGPTGADRLPHHAPWRAAGWLACTPRLTLALPFICEGQRPAPQGQD